MELSTQPSAPWGTRPISIAEAELFASKLKVSATDRASVARTLHDFQPDGMVRGMFFHSLRNALTATIGDARATSILLDHAIGDRFVSFSLYPHRNFYRFWFAAIPQTHPGKSIAQGVERIAETFFPVFLESAAGRTMALLLGRDPITITKRLREAYSISVPHNEHQLEFVSDGLVRWTAKVEPSPFYPEAFIGIMKGAMTEQGATMPKVRTEKIGNVGNHHHKLLFELDWR